MKVIKRKLGREKSWGLAHSADNTIELHSELKGKRLMLYLIHEALHITDPAMSETKVRKISSRLTAVLWKENFRKIEK